MLFSLHTWKRGKKRRISLGEKPANWSMGAMLSVGSC